MKALGPRDTYDYHAHSQFTKQVRKTVVHRKGRNTVFAEKLKTSIDKDQFAKEDKRALDQWEKTFAAITGCPLIQASQLSSESGLFNDLRAKGEFDAHVGSTLEESYMLYPLPLTMDDLRESQLSVSAMLQQYSTESHGATPTFANNWSYLQTLTDTEAFLEGVRAAAAEAEEWSHHQFKEAVHFIFENPACQWMQSQDTSFLMDFVQSLDACSKNSIRKDILAYRFMCAMACLPEFNPEDVFVAYRRFENRMSLEGSEPKAKKAKLGDDYESDILTTCRAPGTAVRCAAVFHVAGTFHRGLRLVVAELSKRDEGWGDSFEKALRDKCFEHSEDQKNSITAMTTNIALLASRGIPRYLTKLVQLFSECDVSLVFELNRQSSVSICHPLILTVSCIHDSLLFFLIREHQHGKDAAALFDIIFGSHFVVFLTTRAQHAFVNLLYSICIRVPALAQRATERLLSMASSTCTEGKDDKKQRALLFVTQLAIACGGEILTKTASRLMNWSVTYDKKFTNQTLQGDHSTYYMVCQCLFHMYTHLPLSSEFGPSTPRDHPVVYLLDQSCINPLPVIHLPIALAIIRVACTQGTNLDTRRIAGVSRLSLSDAEISSDLYNPFAECTPNVGDLIGRLWEWCVNGNGDTPADEQQTVEENNSDANEGRFASQQWDSGDDDVGSTQDGAEAAIQYGSFWSLEAVVELK